MHILVICQYYPPDIGGGSRRASNAVSGLEKLGHSIEVITAFPHYPHGNIPPEYRRKILAIEAVKGRKIIRVWVPPIAHAGFARRLAMYVIFSFSALFALFLVKRPHVIWASNTNVFSSFPAMMFSILWRAPIVRNVDDLWPETAVEEGVLSRRLLWIGEAMAKMAYSICKAITTISSTYPREIARKYGIPRNKFYVAEVGVDTNVFHPPLNQLFNPNNSTQFKVLYSGILGPGYDFGTVIEAANLLRNERGIEFIIRGAGECESEIAERISKEGSTNIKMYRGYLDILALVELLGTADALLLPMKALCSHEAGIPTKLFEYMACGRPVICCCRGETKTLVEQSRCGIVVTPGDPTELAEAIMMLKSNPLIRENMGRNGRNHAVQNYSIERIGEKLEPAFIFAIKPNNVEDSLETGPR